MGFLTRKQDTLEYVIKLALQLVESEKKYGELREKVETLERNLDTMNFALHQMLVKKEIQVNGSINS